MIFTGQAERLLLTYYGGISNGRQQEDNRGFTGLDRKVVDKTMTAMKKDGSIVSPVRCKWEPAIK